MIDFSECEEILNEKNTIKQRMRSYYEELKQVNFKSSEELSRQVFKKLFQIVKEDEDFIDRTIEIEGKLIAGVKGYYENSIGPAAYKVFIEEIVVVFPFFGSIIRDITEQMDTHQDDLLQEIENLKKNREKSRQNEKKLQEILDETIKNYENQLANKEKIINELQSSCNTRVNISETKMKNLSREFKLLQQELEQTQREKATILEAEKEIFNKKLLEYEKSIEKLKEENHQLEKENNQLEKENNQLEKENEENELKYEKALKDKENEIIQLTYKEKSLDEKFRESKERDFLEISYREKVSEAHTEGYEDYSILHKLKQDLAELFIYFHNEQSTNMKMAAQMDKIAILQNDLNKNRLKEIENRSNLINDYEEKMSKLKDEIEELTKENNNLRLNQKNKADDSLEARDANEQLEELKIKITRKNEEISLAMENLKKRDEHIQGLYNVVNVHKKNYEKLETDFEDKNDELHRIKIELTQFKDDNDILLGLMGYSLEVLQKKRNIQAINLVQIQNPSNRNRVIKIFKKFGIPYD